ncbi:hypothetical protein GQ457_04G016640 [Hibiscus cannabinus]
MENPNDEDMRGVASYENPGGRPPEGMGQIGVISALERHSSPVDLEDQRLAKKGRNDDTEESKDMEVDFAEGSTSTDSVHVDTGNRPDDVEVLDEDCIIENSGAFPIIRFSDRVHDQLDRSMQNVIIIRLLGQTIRYGALLNRLHALWHPLGGIQLIDLENNYYLVRFENGRDYTHVLTEGPWTSYGNYLTAQPWHRNFSTNEKHPSQVLVWVWLPGLPYKYYCKALFRRIAQVVRRVIKVYYNTRAGERGKFAKLTIMVDLNKPLTPCIGIDNFIQKLEYEGLQQICFGCGVYGHSNENFKISSGSAEADYPTLNIPVEVSSSSGASSTNLYGPWMIATTRRRQNTNQVEKDRDGTSGYGSGSRFTVLQDVDVENIDAGQETIVVQEDKIRRGVVTATNYEKWCILGFESTRRQRKELVRKDVNSSVVVVPLQADSRPKVMVPRVVPGRGNHTAVSIVEPETSARGGPHCDDHRESGRDILSNRIDPGAERGVMDMIEDDPGDNQAHEFQDDLIVLGSSVDAVLLAGGGVVSSQ